MFNMEPELGVRVVRGPDWEWEDQDVGEGYVGTVAGLEEGGGAVVVQWDAGQRCRYRCGEEGKYDLRILDTGPSGLRSLSRVSCDWCQEERIAGLVWRCVRCLDYHLCSQCYMADSHSTRHQFLRLHHKDPNKRLRMPARSESKRLTARGIFPGAQVIRGVDWKWRDQDGGAGVSGCVLGLKGWQNGSFRSVAQVEWQSSGQKNVYRVGHRGKVDLKCVSPAEGGQYYPDHLPILGGSVPTDMSGDIVAGDTVRVDLDLEMVKLLQEGHGGWDDAMAEHAQEFGLVNYIDDMGDVQVRCNNNRLFHFNIEVLAKVDVPFHSSGDVVRVIDDIAVVHELQGLGPSWVDDMALTLGQVGRIIKRLPNGQVLASVNGQRWLYNPACLLKASNEDLPNNPDGRDVDLNALAKVQVILRQCDSRDAIIYCATSGDVTSLKKYLEQNPGEVNWKFQGKTAVHIACTECYVECLKLLMTYHPDLELLDDNGLKPLHVCAYSNFAEGARILLDSGADINAKDDRSNTATMAAGALGHYNVLNVFLNHHLLNIYAGDHIGSTALHCAVIAWRYTAVKYLLEAGADPSIPNYTAATPLHDAVRCGYLPFIEQIVLHYPEHIDIAKVDNGNTPLHIAAINNSLDIVEFLVSQAMCNVNSKNHGGLTPMHLAAHEGHTAMVECLVGYGADLNSCGEDGNTVLHLVMVLQNMKPLGENTPHLRKVEEALMADYGGFQFDPYLMVVFMLVQEGADPHIKNRIGHGPLQICPSDVATLIRTFTQYRGEYHGSLRPKEKTHSLPKVQKRKKALSSEAAEPLQSPAPDTLTPKNIKKEVSKAAEPPPPDHTSESHQETEIRGSSSDENSSLTQEALCCMCDNVINVQLSPCGHSVMCSDHAGMAKRCPECNVRITQRATIPP